MRLLLSATLTLMLAAAGTAAAGGDLLPTGTLRATYIAANPVQAFVDAKTGEVRGPGAELARELGKRLGVPVTIKGVPGVAGVIDSVKDGAADIGFVAYDPIRAAQVDFSQNYALAQNSYIVPESSPITSVADIDRPGIRVGVAERDAGDYFLTRNLKNAEIRRNPGGDIAVGLKWLADGEIAAYAANRQRLSETVAHTAGIRLLPDNFYGVEQAVSVRKGNTALLEVVDKLLDEARASGLIAGAIARSELVGVDVAPKTAR
jgi:polar amino acid transport system substrate-binding protein